MQLGDYDLLERLGQGGMGAVYKARHRTLGTIRAVKVVSSVSARAEGRFLREISSLALVQHPNVAAIHESGQLEGRLWFAMDLIDGEALDGRLERGALPLPEALSIAEGICDGVEALHAIDVLHRDLKPANVVLTREGRPVVIDLGLAVGPQHERLTKTGSVLGTIAYMAPEQLRGSSGITKRTDVYALGCIVFELITGQPAMQATNIHAVAAKLMTEERPRLRSVDPGLPRALDEVCRRAMARDPQRRYADAAALGAAIRDLPEEATGAPLTWILAGIAVVLLAIGVAVYALTGHDQAPSEEAEITSQEPQDPGPSPAGIVEQGNLALDAARAASLQRRAPLLREWLARFPNHPRWEEAVTLQRTVLLKAPLMRFEHPGARCAAFASDDRGVLSGGKDEVRLWDPDTGAIVRRWGGHPGARDLLQSSDGFLSVGDSAKVLLTTAEESRVLWRGTKTANLRLARSGDGKRLAVLTGEFAREVVVLDLPSGRRVSTLTHQIRVQDMDLSGDGQRAVVGAGQPTVGGDGGIMLMEWTVQDAKLKSTVPVIGIPMGVSFTGDGETYLVADRAAAVALYRIGQGRALTKLIQRTDSSRPPVGLELSGGAHRGRCTDVECAAGKRAYSISSGEDELRVWDVKSRQELHAVGLSTGSPGRLAVSRDGRRVLIVFPTRGVVELWDLSGLTE